MTRRSDDDAALTAELAEAIAESLAAEHVVVWARRIDGYHAVGMWPEPTDEVVPVNGIDQPEIGTGRPSETLRVIARGDTELGVVVVNREQQLSRHDLRLLDGFCGQTALILQNLETVSKLAGSPASGHLDRLTPRELEVLALMAAGLTNAAICEHLHLSIKTVEPAVSSIFTKLDLPPGRESNRRVLAVLAYVDNYRTTSLPA
jgi:hypothetical protein